MASVAVFLHYGGEWDDSMKYSGYSIRGIVVGSECSYDNLLALVSRHLWNDTVQHCIKLHCQLADNSPLIPVCDDISLQCYLELKMGDSDKRCYPIVVNIDDVTNMLIGNQNCKMQDASHGNHRSREICNLETVETVSIVDGSIDETPTFGEIGMELSEYVIVRNDDDDDDLCSNVITKPVVDEIMKGDIFKNKDLVITSVSILAIRNRFQFSVVKSDSNFYWLKCLEGGCKWIFKSSRTGSIGHFKVRETNSTHTCSSDSVMSDHRQATSFVIANCIKRNFLSSKRIYTTGDIVEDMHYTYGVHVSYDKAWRARDRALKMIRGNPDESYGNLPAYMYRLQVANSGSVTRIETDSDNMFLFRFVALGASIVGWKHCKPVIVVDGTFLTSRHGGTLFTACTQDANNNIFILAFGVGDAENNNA